MPEVTLFQQDFTLYQSAHQAHIRYEFYVPEGVDTLAIYFDYSPKAESDPTLLRAAFHREGLAEETYIEGEAFRNLITLSVNDPQRFRGAHHWFNYEQQIRLSTEAADLGFVPGEILAGNWQVILSGHGIFSEQIHGTLRVVAQLVAEPNYLRSEPLAGINAQPRKFQRDLVQAKSKFVKAELHAHTTHSDASQTTEELLQNAQAADLAWLAITDHNTITGIEEALSHEQFGTDVQIIPGLEFTTFYGHFLMHGAPEHLFRNWTEVNLGNINQYLQRLKEQPVNITIAHPFDQGNPYCTGCRWDFELIDLANVDGIEVWNSPDPHLSASNERAFAQWELILAMGYEVAATTGRDWHRIEPDQPTIGYTYLLLPEAAGLNDVLEAMKLGRSYSSVRPHLQQFRVNGRYQLGGRLAIGDLWHVEADWFDLQAGDCISLHHEAGQLAEFTIAEGQAELKLSETFDMTGHRLIRMEVKDAEGHRIAFTNPIYR